MVIRTGWLTGPPMEKKFCLLQPVNVAKQDLTSFTRCLQVVAPLKNFHWLMQSLVLIHPMENRSPWFFVRRWAATGNVIVADGKQISTFSILLPTNQKRSAWKLMPVMNSRCGMAMRSISYLTGDQN